MEIELKMLFPDEEAYTSFIHHPLKEKLLPDQAVQKVVMHSMYFDTRDRRFNRLRTAVRLRMENGQAVLTLKAGEKAQAGVFSRQEWSVNVPSDIITDVQRTRSIEGRSICTLFKTQNRSRSFSDKTFQSLEPLLQQMDGQIMTCHAQIKFNRLMACTVIEGSRIETAVDRGFFIAGKEKRAFLELEIELIEGDHLLLRRLQQELSASFGMLPETQSKLARCLAWTRSDVFNE